MKNRTIAKWSAGLLAVSLPFVGGCVQDSATLAPVVYSATSVGSDTSVASADAGSPAIDAAATQTAARDLENAPVQVVSVAQTPPTNATLNGAGGEIAKLAQAGVDESVMLAYVTNSGHTFNLGSDQIIYLNDIGVPGTVVTAMIQHDQSLRLASVPPAVYSSAPVAETLAMSEAVENQPAPAVPESSDVLEANVTSTYFYDSLSPYGDWIEVEGYGRCWQPTAVVVNRNWTPYGDCGHWVYSDCGWYWASDYSWGWAPFHYGRWFRHHSRGWCWAPDTVWGPSWVSWRYTPDYCGWAPLPPTACYRPGFGFTYFGSPVGIGFGFGLDVGCFTFVPVGFFCDAHPFHHRVPPREAGQIFNHATVVNPVVDGHGDSHFHRGIPVQQIAGATHREIRPVQIRGTSEFIRGNRGEHFDRSHGALTVFRPQLPEPPASTLHARVGEGVQPAVPRNDIHNNITRQPFAGAYPVQPNHRENETPGFRTQTPSSNLQDSHGGNAGNVNNPPRSNRREAPLNSLIVRGQPVSGPQANPPRSESGASQPRNAGRNDFPTDRPQLTPGVATVWPAQNQADRQNQIVGRQQLPRFQTTDDRAGQPVGHFQPTPTPSWNYQAQPTVPVAELRFSPGPPAERPLPMNRPVETMPVPPRVDVRSVPVAPPPAPHGNSADTRSGNNGSGKNR